jgi:hypothetical protein
MSAVAIVHTRAVVAEELRVRNLAITVGHRPCPDCGEWSALLSTWCRACEYRFTPADDRAHQQRARMARQECQRPHGTGAATGMVVR